MATNEGVSITNKSANDGTLCADADLQNILEPPTGGRYLCSDCIFNHYFLVLMIRSARGITSMI